MINANDKYITYVEHLDARKVWPYDIVNYLMHIGYSRSDAIELYRLGTLGWTIPTKN